MAAIPARHQVTTDFRGHQTIPAEFPQILKDFTREILREQPDNLYRFGRDYFERLAYPDAVGDASGDDSRRPFESMSDEELLAWLTEIFVTADTDNNGSLDREEFKVVMSGLNLTPAEAMQVFREADVDESGMLEYEEFLPLMVQVLMTISNLDTEAKEEQDKHELAEAIADDYIYRGMTGAEMEAMMLNTFLETDTNQTGVLEIKEFKRFIKKCNIHLTKKEVNTLFMTIDADGNGCVDIEEFIPVFHDVMRMMIADEALKKMNESTVHELPQILIHECKKFDPDDTGLITSKKLCRAIEDADVGVSHFQIYSVISELWMLPGVSDRVLHGDRGELVDYSVFINEHVAPAFAKLIDVDFEIANHEARVTQKQLAEMTARAYEELGMTPDEFSSVLHQVFVEYDKNENGSLDPQEFEEAITSSGIQFSPKEKMMMLLAADENEDGDISYGEFAAVALQMMVWARKEQLVNPIKEEMGDEFSPVAQASRDSLPSPPSNPDSPGGADGQPAEGE